MMEIQIEPKEALTGFLDIPGVGKLWLDFLITSESGLFYIRCLDLGIMSCGQTVEECKENIQEAISIYLEDLPEGANLFKPAPARYWKMFYELLKELKRRKDQKLSAEQRQAIRKSISTENGLVVQYA